MRVRTSIVLEVEIDTSDINEAGDSLLDTLNDWEDCDLITSDDKHEFTVKSIISFQVEEKKR